MNLFLSWSGERSRRTAELLSTWIRGVVQQIKPWMSTEIDRGALWFPEIGTAINSVENGIVCLTRENHTAPWILFEAGALAKNFGSQRVCTFLIDLQPKDISDPLAQFNHTLPNKESMFQLMKTLNARLGDDALPEKVLEPEFKLHWSLFEKEFNKILSETKAGEAPPQKSDRELLEEVLKAIQKLDYKMFPNIQKSDYNMFLNMFPNMISNVPMSPYSSTAFLESMLRHQINKAQLLFSHGDHREAIEILQRIIELDNFSSCSHIAKDLLEDWNKQLEDEDC